MKHAQTIAMARDLLAEGRVRDVATMLEPLLEPAPVPGALNAEQLALRTLLARGRLLRYGDPAGAGGLLQPFEAEAARAALAPGLRAEGVLWLGWMYGWPHAPSYAPARALYLLDEAAQLFEQALDPAGRCFALLGQALAYAALGEQGPMRQALDEAVALQQKVADAHATLWTLDGQVRAARLQGHYTQALASADVLHAQAQALADPFAEGRALAYRAALFADLGRPPAAIVEAATAAEALLPGAAAQPAGWLVPAYTAHVCAERRRGAWRTADRVIATALGSIERPAPAHLVLERVALYQAQGRLDDATACLNNLDARRPRAPHPDAAARATLSRSRLLARQHQAEDAHRLAVRATTLAREAGDGRLHLTALLHLAHLCLDQGREPESRAPLQESHTYADYFSLLPVAAQRFAVLGARARAEEATEEARAFIDQARAAYTLIGDVYQAAQMQVRLARLDQPRRPAQARATLADALATFEHLGAALDYEDARALYDAWPPAPAGSPLPAEVDIGAALGRASLSVDLVAEAWLRAASHLLPGRWMGLYRCDEGHAWQCVREHGTAPAAPPRMAEPCSARLQTGGVLWLRLRAHPGPAFFFGVAVPEPEAPAWQEAFARMKPWLPVAGLALDHALLHARQHEAAAPARPPARLGDLVFASPAMRAVAEQGYALRGSHSPVLLTGERGVGKAHLAQALHAASERCHAPFVSFACADVAGARGERRLFGQATPPADGALHAAEGGTLFLDDVDALPLDAQRTLLRFLQDGTVPGRPGRALTPPRLLAASQHDLHDAVRAGHFLDDLYYRLHVLCIHVPPLRQRREDIPLLTRHFLDTLRPPGTPPPALTHAALDALLRYAWPGNVRQLRNEIERLLLRVRSEPAPLIDAADLAADIRNGGDATVEPALFRRAQEAILLPEHDLDQVLADTEKVLIERVLAEHAGQITASAQALGLSRQGLYKKLKRLGIDASQFHADLSPS